MGKRIIFICLFVSCCLLLAAADGDTILRMPIVKYTDAKMEKAINEFITDNFEKEVIDLFFFRDSAGIKFTIECDYLFFMEQYPDENLPNSRIAGIQVLPSKTLVVIFDRTDHVDHYREYGYKVDYLPDNHGLFCVDSAARVSRRAVKPFKLDRNNNVVVNLKTYGIPFFIFMEAYVDMVDLVKLNHYNLVDNCLYSLFDFAIADNADKKRYVWRFERKDDVVYGTLTTQLMASVLDSDTWGYTEYKGKKILLAGEYNDSTDFVATGDYDYFLSFDYRPEFFPKHEPKGYYYEENRFVPDSACFILLQK